jgi:hypothetical protein
MLGRRITHIKRIMTRSHLLDLPFDVVVMHPHNLRLCHTTLANPQGVIKLQT